MANDIPPIPEYLYSIQFVLGITQLLLNLFIFLYIIIHLYGKDKTAEIKIEKRHRTNLITWALFFLLILIQNILLVINQFFIARQNISTELDPTIERIAILLIYSAFLVKILYIEFIINDLKLYKTHRIFSIAFLGVMIIIVLYLEAIKVIGPMQFFFLGLLIFSWSIIPILYLILAIKTAGESRKNALKVFIGSLLFAAGAMLGPLNLKGYYGISPDLDNLINYTLIIGPLIAIIAILIIFDSFRKIKGS